MSKLVMQCILQMKLCPSVISELLNICVLFLGGSSDQGKVEMSWQLKM